MKEKYGDSEFDFEVDEILDYSINVNNREVYKGTVLGNGGTVYIDIDKVG